MENGIHFEVIWFDQDVIEVVLSCSKVARTDTFPVGPKSGFIDAAVGIEDGHPG
jgi:hypothetical protein